MRPVNLIPSDERRGDSAPLRTGNLIYVLVGGLVLLLVGIVAVALTSKQISDRQEQKAGLQQELSEATARANSLAAFSNFRAMEQSRVDTVTSLAQSRFDWNRVLHELSLVLPEQVRLSTLVGTVAPDVDIDAGGGTAGSGSADLRSGIAGPALDISGCAPDQPTVAAFVASLEDIDGVTRVGLDTSKEPDSQGEQAASGSAGSEGESTECDTGTPRKFDFHIVVAFDAVPTPQTATSSPSVPPAAAPASGGESQVAAAQTGTPGG